MRITQSLAEAETRNSTEMCNGAILRFSSIALPDQDRPDLCEDNGELTMNERSNRVYGTKKRSIRTGQMKKS
jgi:hypothetical protein